VLPPSDEFAQLRALRWALAAQLPPDEQLLAQRRAEEQALPVKQLRDALLPEKPRKQLALQAGAEPPERARPAWCTSTLTTDGLTFSTADMTARE